MDRSILDKNYAMIARLLLGGYFVYSGLANLVNLSTTARELNLSGAIVLVILAASFKIILGLAVMFRYHTRYAAFGLLVYIMISSLLVYGPYTWASHETYQYIFVRNFAIAGGLLFLLSQSRGWKEWNDEFFSPSEQALFKQKKHEKPHP